MCEDEIKLAAAVNDPTTFFSIMSAYPDDRSRHPTPLKPWRPICLWPRSLPP